MQQTLVVSGISLTQADHGAASVERRSDAEPDSTRSRSSIETTTSPHLASGHLTPKMSIKRNVILHDFADVIDALYAGTPVTEGQSTPTAHSSPSSAAVCWR